jgi:MFS superfamily sulfate permease-like transporter
MNRFYHELKYDFPASVVVFFVAVPLCLGIALASGTPLFAGIIAGIVGGIVVGIASSSSLGVSGPAAGLAAVVISSMAILGNSWEAFLFATVLAGIIQIIAGYLGGGVIAYYVPSSVIKGMLAGIGVIIIMKQLPFAFGFNISPKGGLLVEEDNHIFLPFMDFHYSINLAAVIVTGVSLVMLEVWDKILTKKHKIFQLIQGPMVVVFFGIFFVWCGKNGYTSFLFKPDQLVNIPVSSDTLAFIGQLTFPDFSQWNNPNVYKVAFIIAVIASIETLLCVEASDRLDPLKRITSTDRELKAQGLGNIVCGLIGGLPVTQVIVRSSANITFGARTKLSAILHGVLILVCVLTIPKLLNMIPLATLASILLVVGYKLAKPTLMVSMYRLGWEQFIPFIVTLVGIVFKDLLFGICLGMALGIVTILRHNYKNSHATFKTEKDQRQVTHLTLAEEVSFLNKGSILHELHDIPEGSEIVIDASKTKSIDYDVLEAIRDFMITAKSKNILVAYKESV